MKKKCQTCFYIVVFQSVAMINEHEYTINEKQTSIHLFDKCLKLKSATILQRIAK